MAEAACARSLTEALLMANPRRLTSLVYMAPTGNAGLTPRRPAATITLAPNRMSGRHCAN